MFLPAMNKFRLLWTLLGFIWAEYLWDMYLVLRQYFLVMSMQRIPKELCPVITRDMFRLSRRYTLEKLEYDMAKLTYGVMWSSATVYFGLPAKYWSFVVRLRWCTNEVGLTCIWLVVLMVMQILTQQVTEMYRTFILERKYGFHRMTIGFYVWDHIKLLVVKLFLTLPVSAVTIYIIKHTGAFFCIWLWLAMSLFSFILITVYPALIAPLFDTYRPLQDGVLRDRIERLTASVRFPLTKIYVMESTNRANLGNAFLYGFFHSKRIVLYDTLIDDSRPGALDIDEVLGVLAHELGHWHHNHILKNVVATQLNLLVTFVCFAFVYKLPIIYECIGFRRRVKPVLAGMMIIAHYILSPYNFLMSYFMTWQSRRFERQADAFSIRLKRSKALANALMKMYRYNMQLPIFDRLYSAWHLSHPPLLERLEGLRNKKRK